MKDTLIKDMSEAELKIWLSKNKVCFVTNTRCMPGSLYLASLKTYIDKIPIHNFWIIPGERNGQPFYGVHTYMYMLDIMLQLKKYDYVIYIDEDCFITDFNGLVEEFSKFKDSNCCLGGPQDGGVFCHRNHSKYMINTFLCFWNIKMLIDKGLTAIDFKKYYGEKLEHQDTIYEDFLNDMSANKSDLLLKINENALKMIHEVSLYRKDNFPNNGETDYAQIVKNDKNNPIEPNQIPYTYKTEKGNFEPYYLVQEALIELTDTPIYYLFATDYYEAGQDKEKLDISGLTSAIYSTDNTHKLVAVHTWYSRAYTKWPNVQQQLDHTKRINTIIKKFSKI